MLLKETKDSYCRNPCGLIPKLLGLCCQAPSAPEVFQTCPVLNGASAHKHPSRPTQLPSNMGSAILLEKQHLVWSRAPRDKFTSCTSDRFLVLLCFFSRYAREVPPQDGQRLLLDFGRWAIFSPLVVFKYIDASPVNLISHLLVLYDWASELFYPPVDTNP